MEKHRSLNDTMFEQQFKDLSLAPELFTHEAHLRLAWIFIRKYGIEKATDMACNHILQFATKYGDPDKFHKTITVASVKVVNHFMQKSNSNTFLELIEEYPRLKHQFKVLLDQHYDFNIFTSEEAKKTYLEPDLLPF